MYDLRDYEVMFSDAVRTRAYADAIARMVKPGDVVVEIGTGVGYFAVLAARAGARHVYAIESNPVVALGPAVARANDCDGRITFLQGRSQDAQLPERGTVLVEDLRGLLPLHGAHVEAVRDARERLLVPDARIIPERDILWLAPCTTTVQCLDGSGDSGAGLPRLDRSVARDRLRHDMHRVELEPAQLLAPAATWGDLRYATISSPDVRGEAHFVVARHGRLDGFGLWFEAALGGECGFSTAPDHPLTVYGQAFLPLPEALDVEAGDRVHVGISATLVDADYVFAWRTELAPVAGAARQPRQFRQSTLGGFAIAARQLEQRRIDARPDLGTTGAVVAALLSLADGTRTFSEIAAGLSVAFPARFRTEREALRFATDRVVELTERGHAIEVR